MNRSNYTAQMSESLRQMLDSLLDRKLAVKLHQSNLSSTQN